MSLRGALDALPADVSARWREVLDELDALRSQLARAPEDPDRVVSALEALEAAFTAHAEVTARRAGGQAYAGRALVYEDCRRDLKIEIGSPIIEAIAPALSLVLSSARWWTHRVARVLRARLRALLEARGTARVALIDVWRDLEALVSDPSLYETEARAIQEAWLEIFGPLRGPITITSTDVKDRALACFAAPGPGWPSARHHSPDLLIAARGVDRIERGEYLVVLGELHVGLATIANPAVLAHCPWREEIVRRWDDDLAEPLLWPVWSKKKSRADFSSPSHRDLELEMGDTRSHRPPSNRCTIAELDLVDEGSSLRIRSIDRRLDLDAVAFFDRHLTAEAHSRFALLPPLPHAPRITIDRLVVARERWICSTASILSRVPERQAERRAAVERWVEEMALPRRVFAKIDVEPKPIFVDFDAPVLIDAWIRQLRRGTSVVLTEMLPDLGSLWLTDAEGERYTSELRVVAVDPVRFSGV
jgi:hypothetical protein